MESLFFGSAGLHCQNFSRASRASKATPIPGYFVKYSIDRTTRFSSLRVDVVSTRSFKSLEDSSAEFQRPVELRFSELFGEEKWKQIKRWLTIPPAWTCIRVSDFDNIEDVTQRLQCEIDKFNGNRPETSRCRLSKHPMLKNYLRLDFAPPILDIRNLPSERVVVDAKCGEAVLRGADVFAPGISGSSAGLIEDTMVSVYIDLDSVVLKGDKDVSESSGKRLLFVGIGITLQSRLRMFTPERSGVAVKMLHRPTGDSPSLNEVLVGRIYLQNLPSATVGFVLDPQPSELVLDMCASPGGKTSHLADLMNDQGIVIACDRTVAKCIPVKQACDNFSASRKRECVVRVCQCDSSKSGIYRDEAQQELSREERRNMLHQHMNSLLVDGASGITLLPPGSLPKGVFDRVLLDGPCSALGLRPRFSHIETTCRALDDMSSRQKQLLFNALTLVKAGGIIVYSTCTINDGENEQVVKWFLKTYGDYAQLVKAEPIVGGPGLASILGDGLAMMVQRFDPSDATLDSTGFFLAKFVKTRPLTASVVFMPNGPA